jgi:hypothetical protein
VDAGLGGRRWDDGAPMRLKVGDKVKWRSSNKDKEGTVVHVLSRHTSAFDAWSDYREAGGTGTFMYGGGIHRSHESYLVQIGNEFGKVYWPRVSLLVPVTK